jgi:hypothetical protein
MTDFAGRGPLGQKTGKRGPKERKPISPRSKKRQAYAATTDCADSIAHMGRVKAMACVCCGKDGPSEAHHVKDDGAARNNWRVIPLCTECHRGQHGYHNAKNAWRARYGLDVDYLAQVYAAVGGRCGV